MRYVLEDEFHSEWLRKFDSAEDAIEELRRLEALTPDELVREIGPTPCGNRSCVRELHVIEETGKEIATAKPR